MRIGELARRSGVRPATLRYYESRGLLSRPERTHGGYRSYTADAVAQLRLIRWAKGLGFTLREIRQMTDAIGRHAGGNGTGVRRQVQSKIAEIDRRIRQLGAIRGQLEDLAGCRCTHDCPVIRQVLAEPPPDR